MSAGTPGAHGFILAHFAGGRTGADVVEGYASREAFAAHRETPHFQELVLDGIVPLLESRTVEAYDAEPPA
jgi:quinol monooxygenase YgiN